MQNKRKIIKNILKFTNDRRMCLYNTSRRRFAPPNRHILLTRQINQTKTIAFSKKRCSPLTRLAKQRFIFAFYTQSIFYYQLHVVALGKHFCGSFSSTVITSPFNVTISVSGANAYLCSLDGIGINNSFFFMYPVT